MKKVILFTTLILLVIMVGCEKEESVNTLQKENYDNPNPSQNNNEIITEKSWGYDDIVKSITINNDIYTIGYPTIKYNSTLRKISKSGKEIWSKTIDINPKNIFKLDDKRLIVVGYKKNKGSIRIYDIEGNLLASKDEYIENFRLSFSNIIKDGIDGFLISGNKRADNISQPFLRGITISADNKITNSYLLKIKGIRTNDYCTLGSIQPIQDLDFIISMLINDKYIIARLTPRKVSYSTSQYNTYSNEIDEPNEPIYSINIMWQKEIMSSSSNNYFIRSSKQLIAKDNKIFHIGSYGKRKTSSSVEEESGLVSCLDLDGNIQWQRKINPSNKSDELYKAIYYNSNLFIVGEHSGCFIKDIYKSNGLLVKMDKYGEILYTKTFGDKNLKQSFTSIEVIDNKLKLLGYKGKYKKEMKNWFLEINP